MRPDRVVIGAESDRAREVLRRLYRPLYLIEAPIVFTGIETAELTKYAANAFLAMKVTFINEMADLCEKVGADVHDVARGIGLDGRIGRKFLHPGPGYRRLLLPQGHAGAGAHRAGLRARRRGWSRRPSRSTTRARRRMAMRVIAACGGSVRGKTIGVLGLTFKPETDDMRDAPSLADRRAAGGRRRERARLRSAGHGAGPRRCCRQALPIAATRWMRSPGPMRWC